MKTIEETAKEFSENIGESLTGNNSYKQQYIIGRKIGFKAGIEFAQRWIPVEEDIPKFEGEEFQILVKGHKYNPDKVVCWTVGIAENESIIRSIFTHWRPIELK